MTAPQFMSSAIAAGLWILPVLLVALTSEIVENFRAFCLAFNIHLFDWQAEAFGAAMRREGGRFVHPLAGICVPRGDGKSWGASGVGIWRLIAGRPGTKILSVALDLDGTEAILSNARQIVRGHPELDRAIEVRANGLYVPATGSEWTGSSREHTASRGEHPDVVLYDEVGWARDDELFASLLAGQASVADPLMLVVSTVGRRRSGPLWRVKSLAEGGDTSVFWHHHSANRSPFVTPEFLARQRRILLPAQFAREHQNQWIDGADAFTTAADVDGAMGRGWREQSHGRAGVRYRFFIDIGTIHDPTVIAIGHDEDGVVHIDRLVTFQGNREHPVQLAAVEDMIRELAKVFPADVIEIESWQGAAAVQNLQRLGLPVVIVAPTAKLNAEQWPLLAARLAAGSLVLFPHARLREELLNLIAEVGPSGVKVLDRGKVHQDHAVAVRGVVASLTAAAATRCRSPLCRIPHCDGKPPWALLFSKEAMAWDAMHPTVEQQAARAEVEVAVDAAMETEAAEAAPGLGQQVRELVAQGFSRLTQLAQHRRATRDRVPVVTREERIAAALTARQRQQEEQEAREAAQRAVAEVTELVERNGGCWMPHVD